jgi:hypothetical protein
MSQFAGQTQFGYTDDILRQQAVIKPARPKTDGGWVARLIDEEKTRLIDEEKMNKAINDGTLSQSQANQIAQKIYKHNEFAKSAKFSQGYIPPTINWSDQLKKSGYEYKEVTASPSKGMMQVFTPAHGEAVKISSASATEPKTTTTSTSATTPTEESFFEKNKTAIIIVAGFALAGTAYYFYTKKKK